MRIKTETLPGNETPVETPTAKIVREGRPTHTVIDAGGRKIVYRQLSVLDEVRLVRFIGGELAANQEYMRYARIACCVVSIDGEAGVVPNKVSFLETRIDWVNDDGYLAIWTDMVERNRKEGGNEDEVEDEGAALKN